MGTILPQFDLEDFLTRTLDTLGTLNKWCEKCGGRFTTICPDCTTGACWFCARHRGYLCCEVCERETDISGDWIDGTRLVDDSLSLNYHDMGSFLISEVRGMSLSGCPRSGALHRDCRMGAADHEDEETWAPFPPNITVVVQQRRDPQGGPVTSTPTRQGRSPTSPRSPVLGYGLVVRTSSLFRMSGTPTSATTYSSTGSTLVVPSAASTNVRHTVTSPDGGDVMSPSQQSRTKGRRLSGVDKEGSDTINVIILQAILALKPLTTGLL
jgi:hypothetical protein